MFVDVRTYDEGVTISLIKSDVGDTSLLTRLLLAYPPAPTYDIRVHRHYAEVYPEPIHGCYTVVRDAIEDAYARLGAAAVTLAATGFRRWSIYDQQKLHVIPFPICTLSVPTLPIWMTCGYLNQLWACELVVEKQRIVLRPTWPPIAPRPGLLGIGTYEMCCRLAVAYCQSIDVKDFC